MKIGEFFEKHVQWIALGLAGVWLLWVGWAYGVNRPEVEVGGQKFSAGSVDEHIRDTDMVTLSGKLGNPNVPAMEVPDFTEAFASAMNGQPPTQIPALVLQSPPPYQLTEWTGGNLKPPPKWVVTELPKPVVPTDVTVLTGRSLTSSPQTPPILLAVNNKNNANNGDNANGGNQTIFTDNAVQAQPAAGGGNAAAADGGNGGVQQVVGRDRTWETVFAKLNFNEQDKEFARVKLPPYLMQKQYIEVQLQRQEVLPDGTFGDIQLVQGLSMNKPPVDRKNAADFIKWSADPEAQKIILAPPFYNVVKGTSWEVPHKDIPQVAQAADQQQDFNLAQKYQDWKNLKTDAEKAKFTDGWTADQKRAFYNFRRAEMEKEAAQKSQQNNTRQNQQNGRYAPGGRGSPPAPPSRQPRGGENDAVDPQLLRQMYADGGPPMRRPGYPREYEGAYRRRDVRRPEGDSRIQPYQQDYQQQQQILVNLQPDNQGNIDIWAHDENAVAGHTYRYRLRAIIKNPLYDTNIGSPVELNKVPYLPGDPKDGTLDMTSAWSAWSKPVAIPTNVDMMLVSASNLGGKETAKFRIKRFQEGQINEALDAGGRPKPFEVAPGDTIGGPEKISVANNNANTGVATTKQMVVDFTTSWMLVDIRQMGSDYRVRIMDAQGRMETRTVIGDRGKFKDDSTVKPTAAGPGNTTVGLVRQP